MPFDPATLAPVAWYRADDLALANGDPVTAWADLSGNGYDLGPTPGATSPLYAAAALNGHAGVAQTGANGDSRMRATGFATSQPRTVYVVLAGLYPADNSLVSDPDGASWGAYWTGTGPTAHLTVDGLDASLDAGALPTDAYVGIAWDNAGGAVARVNGAEVASAAIGADYGTPDGIEVGGFPFDPATSATFCEVLLFDYVLDGTQTANLEGYLADRYFPGTDAALAVDVAAPTTALAAALAITATVALAAPAPTAALAAAEALAASLAPSVAAPTTALAATEALGAALAATTGAATTAATGTATLATTLALAATPPTTAAAMTAAFDAALALDAPAATTTCTAGLALACAVAGTVAAPTCVLAAAAVARRQGTTSVAPTLVTTTATFAAVATTATLAATTTTTAATTGATTTATVTLVTTGVT